MKLKLNIFFFLILIGHTTIAQMEAYNYARQLHGMQEPWHRVILPDELFEKSLSDMADIRIFGITNSNDTLEAPFIWSIQKEEAIEKSVPFTLINQSVANGGYFFTLQTPIAQEVNKIVLEFEEQNFDWKVNLEGSHTQQDWFTILKDYRILSIKNAQDAYQFTTIAFPDSKYRFFRISIVTDQKPNLLEATVTQEALTTGNYREFDVKKVDVEQNKNKRESSIDLTLTGTYALSFLGINVSSDFEYYRPIAIQYVQDSFETEVGWKYNYQTIYRGTLSSLEVNEFHFKTLIANRIRIIVSNGDNAALRFDTFTVKGYQHELIARVHAPADYYLVYGSERVQKPDYDIGRFRDVIPANLKDLKIDDEIVLRKETIKEAEPMIKNTLWLWIVMVAVIALLAWSTIAMMKKG